MASPKPLIALFGATGGCTLACAVECLNSGFDCTALARTPSKLTNMLLERNVPQTTIDAHLTVTPGDILKVEDVKGPLSLSGRPADIIISGIGAYSMSDITICTNGVNNIISTLKELKPAKKPLLIVLSSTGITKTGPRDVPLAFMPLYHWLLKAPHKDKISMEAAVFDEAKKEDSAIGGFVVVRPSLLMNGDALGGEKIRVGADGKPAVGYTIRRNDVGLWLFENLVRGDNSKFVGEMPSITY